MIRRTFRNQAEEGLAVGGLDAEVGVFLADVGAGIDDGEEQEIEIAALVAREVWAGFAAFAEEGVAGGAVGGEEGFAGRRVSAAIFQNRGDALDLALLFF